jgi:peroxiredoxin
MKFQLLSLKKSPLIFLLLPFSFSLFFSFATASEVTINDPAPQFELMGDDGKTHQLSSETKAGKWVVLEWFNEGCPFVRKHYDSNNMQKLQEKFSTGPNSRVIWYTIISSRSGKQGYVEKSSDAHKIKVKEKSQATAILLDHEGKVGKSYGAKTTPHLFIVSPEGKLAYEGGIDDIASTDSSDIPKSTNYIELALTSALKGEKIKLAKTKPYGCSVKY